MTLKEPNVVFLPNYKLDDKLQKSNLFNFCSMHSNIKDYHPDDSISSNIPRELLISVRFVFFKQDYIFLEK